MYFKFNFRWKKTFSFFLTKDFLHQLYILILPFGCFKQFTYIRIDFVSFKGPRPALSSTILIFFFPFWCKEWWIWILFFKYFVKIWNEAICKQSSSVVIVYMYVSYLIVSFNQMLLSSLDNMIKEYIELVIFSARNYLENLKSQTQICNHCFYWEI